MGGGFVTAAHYLFIGVDMDDEDSDGCVCPECGEWFELWTNAGGLGLNFCPCCGSEWKGSEDGKEEN